ncbi:MAG: hypothetical protein ABW096_04495 [Candidatus Thiodiazotropha sp.]
MEIRVRRDAFFSDGPNAQEASIGDRRSVVRKQIYLGGHRYHPAHYRWHQDQLHYQHVRSVVNHSRSGSVASQYLNLHYSRYVRVFKPDENGKLPGYMASSSENCRIKTLL